MITSKVERGFFRDPKLDIGFLYGGYPLDGLMVVPSHSPATDNIKPVVEFNRNKILEIENVLLDFLHEEHNCTECATHIFNYYNLNITYNKYMLILSTVRIYLSYLSNSKRIKNYFKDNRLVFINESK